MMAVSPSSFFAFLLVVAHLVILDFAAASEKYQRNCPESFDSCGNTTTGEIKFPFTTDKYPGCGLCTVNCSGKVPTIQFVKGREWYQLKEIGDEVIIINLRNLTSSKFCELFDYVHPLPGTHSIYFNALYPPSTSHTTLLKCGSRRDELGQQIADYFHDPNYHQYQGCSQGFTVYYRYPPPTTATNEIPPPPPPPNGCTAIQLPMLPSSEKPNASDVFSVLDVEDVDFSIHWNVSEQCLKCLDDRGQCSHECLTDGNWQF